MSYVIMPLVGFGQDRLKASRLFPNLRSGKVTPAGQQLRNSLVLGFRCQGTEVLSPDTRTLTPETSSFLQHVVRKNQIRVYLRAHDGQWSMPGNGPGGC